MKIKPLLLVTLAAACSASLVYAQGPDAPPGPPGPPPHPMLQLVTALDTDGDGIISASEIANATASLKALDKNGDGELTPEEYGFPQPPSGAPNPAGGRGGKQPPSPQGGQHFQGPQGPPPPAPLERLAIVRALANSDGVITADAIANAPALLKKLDKNGDGQLSPAEYGPMHGGPLVWALDTDGDGIISAQEIANAATSLKLLDKNGDGQLTVDEYEFPAPPDPSQGGKTRGKQSANQPDHPPSPLVTALDTDGDGTISAAEIAAAPETLKTLDKNGDGQLGPGEYNPPPPPPPKD